MCKGEKNQKDSPSKSQSTAKYVQEEEQEEWSDSDFTFQVRVDQPHLRNCAIVAVRVNGIKRRKEADSCSTANIPTQAGKTLELTQEQDCSVPHRHPVICVCTKKTCIPCRMFWRRSISTGSRTIATFLVTKGTTKSRPLLSLDTCIELGLLHLTKATHEKKTEKASQTSAS